MFCCRGTKCLEDEQKGKEGKRTRNQQFYLQRREVPSVKIDGKLNPNVFNSVVKDNAKLLKPDVKHVTNMQKDIYVKLNSVFRSNGNSKTIGYLEGNYQVFQIPRSRSAVIRHSPLRAPISQLKLSATKDDDLREKEQKTESVKLNTEFKEPDVDTKITSPFEIGNNGIKLSDDDAVAIFDNSDRESLSNEQRNALEQLEETLNEYHIDDDDVDDESPIIVADVLPYGVFEEFKTDIATRPPESSEDEPSSRTSSLSNKSVNSRTGIISENRHSISSKKNRNSVSFQLPVDYVDKPYAPMQTCAKPKHILIQMVQATPEPVPQPPAICVSGNNVNIWHTGSNVHIENKHQRRMSGPFKGSFKSLFYRKYNGADMFTYNGSKTYLTPKIMEKVASFESLNSENVSMKYRGSAAVVRRNTIR